MKTETRTGHTVQEKLPFKKRKKLQPTENS